MGKNRKNQSAAVRFGPALKVFILCALVGGSGVGYVWQKNQIHQMGQQMKEREIRLKALRAEIRELQAQYDALRSPIMLQRRIREMNLGLVPPHPSHVWHLRIPGSFPEQTPEPLAIAQERNR
jgi:hypothetical protein